jgi:hypothetical protein
MFEPKPGVQCNVNEMFRCYAENYLSDYPEFEWGGYIVMDVKEHKYNMNAAGEPFYQFVASDATDVLLKQIVDYTKKNPMHGYHRVLMNEQISFINGRCWICWLTRSQRVA